MPRDLYDILGVPSTASEAEIRRAFRTLAKMYHPDVNRDHPAAIRRFIEAREAAETLLDPGRRASYDKSRTLGAPAGPMTVAPKPPPSPGTSRVAGTPPPTAPEPFSERFVNTAIAVVVIAMLAVAWVAFHSPQEETVVTPNGTVVWKAAGFRLGNGWGINLAGDGARIQVVPGTSADLEVADGYLSAGGHIALLPHGEALTYQHCVSAMQRATSQSEPLSEIASASRSSLCASGSGGDLASIQVTHDDGSSLVVNITVWEYV